tara:strand:+ start:709 stop:1641 length:933 start_codon:yes stop_codon:yes gene_type:complete
MAAVGNNLSSNAFITMFGDEVTHIAQQKASKLQGAVRTVRGVVGSTYRFPVLGKAGVIKNKTAKQDIEALSQIDIDTGSSGQLDLDSGTFIGDSTGTTAAEVDVMNHTNKTATLDNYSTGEYVDDFDALKTNIDLRSAYAGSIASAMSRAYDTVIIGALDSARSSMTAVAETTSGTLVRADLQAVHNALNAKDVPMNDRYLVVDSATYGDILGDTNIVGNADGPLSQALATGILPNVLGFNIIMSNLLTAVDANETYSYAFHKDAVGMAIGKDITTMVNYVPQKLSTLIAAEFSAGSVVIDPTACVSLSA